MQLINNSLFILIAFILTLSPVIAQDDTSEDQDKPMTEEEEKAMIGEALANPLSYLWLVFMQNDTQWWKGDVLDALGEDTMAQNTFLLQPVLSIQLSEKWKTIIRPVIPINSFESVDYINISTNTVNPTIQGVEFDRKTGLGDIVLWTAFSNKYTPPFIFGFGPTLMLNTASENLLGTGKWSAGPMVMGVNVSEKWIFGGVFQHWWSFAGQDSFTINTSLGPQTVPRSQVNLTDFQLIYRYRINASTNIGGAPNIRYNWDTDQLSLPLGLGGDFLVKLGPLPVKVGAEFYYFFERDDNFGPDFQLRLLFVPVLPSPEWSRKPIFN